MNSRQKVTGVNPRPQVNVGTRTPKSPTSGEPTKRGPFSTGEKSFVSKTFVRDGTKTRKMSDDKSSSSSVKSSSSSIDNTDLHISEDKISNPRKGIRELEQKSKESSLEDKSSAFLIKKRNSLRKTDVTAGERSHIPKKSSSFRSDDLNGLSEKYKNTSSIRKASFEKTVRTDSDTSSILKPSFEKTVKTDSDATSSKNVSLITSKTVSDKPSVSDNVSDGASDVLIVDANVVTAASKTETVTAPSKTQSVTAPSKTESVTVPSKTELDKLVTPAHKTTKKTAEKGSNDQNGNYTLNSLISPRSPMEDTGTQTCLSEKAKVFSQFTCPEQPGYVGFANLPNQVHRKSVKKGFEFTLMVVGESGLGKSTLVNSLFLTDLYPERLIHSAAEKIKQTVKIDASTVEIEERGVKLRLTVVDTPGFGDSLNSIDCFKPIIQYVDDQFERYLQDESGLNRRHIIDNRVHCCFYFINPSGHGLRPLDIAFMKAVHHKVNIVPVIAKADTLTKQEVQRLKKKILDQIDEYGISIYPLPDCDSDEDEDYREQCRQLKEAVPFAVIGANTVIEVKGRKVRGRMYPWGVVEVENPEHCDFIKLRTMLITHMQDLQEVTQEVHYENFRADKLANGGGGASMKKVSKNRRPESIVGGDEKEKQLAEKDAELRKMQEMLTRMQAEMDAQKRMTGGTPGKQNGGIKSENV